MLLGLKIWSRWRAKLLWLLHKPGLSFLAFVTPVPFSQMLWECLVVVVMVSEHAISVLDNLPNEKRNHTEQSKANSRPKLSVINKLIESDMYMKFFLGA